MTRQQIIRCVAFCLVVCLMLGFLCDLFENERTRNYDSRLYTYREYNENTVDAVFIGTSGVDRYWIGAKAYEDYGMTVYPLSTDGMPSWLYADMVEYALKYQNPKLVLLDIRAFCQSSLTDNMTAGDAKDMDVRARRILDALPWLSPQWFKVAFKTMNTIHSVNETQPRFDISLLLSFVRFHDRWHSMTGSMFKKNLGNLYHEYCGFYMLKATTPAIVPQETFVYHDTVQSPMDPTAEAAFYEVIQYAKDNGVELVFVDTPQFPAEHEIQRANYIYAKLDEMDIDYVTYYTAGEGGPFSIDLNPETDFYNSSHVNYYGAVKFTDSLAKYLDGNYDLPDRRSDPAAQENWGGVYEKIQITMEDFAESWDISMIPAEGEEEEE